MSDRDLRRILNDIIQDIDAGRLRAVRSRMPTARGVRNMVGTAMLAATLGMSTAGCDDRSVGTATDAGVRDSTVQIDAGGDYLYAIPFEDAGAQPEYAEPFYDAGLMPAYGEPFYDDAGTEPLLDAGDVPAYMGPPAVDAAVEPDSGPQTAYGVPPCPPPDGAEDGEGDDDTDVDDVGDVGDVGDVD